MTDIPDVDVYQLHREPKGTTISDTFDVDIEVPVEFPRQVPNVRETGCRIPKDFHTHPDGTLCLGAPTRLLLLIQKAQTLPGFIDSCVVPYFYGFSHREQHGALPFGELDHGLPGIFNDLMQLFDVRSIDAVIPMLRLASIPKREANKQKCPCGSGRLTRKCHNIVLNHLRSSLGRSHFRQQLRLLEDVIKWSRQNCS